MNANARRRGDGGQRRAVMHRRSPVFATLRGRLDATGRLGDGKPATHELAEEMTVGLRPCTIASSGCHDGGWAVVPCACTMADALPASQQPGVKMPVPEALESASVPRTATVRYAFVARQVRGFAADRHRAVKRDIGLPHSRQALSLNATLRGPVLRAVMLARAGGLASPPVGLVPCSLVELGLAHESQPAISAHACELSLATPDRAMAPWFRAEQAQAQAACLLCSPRPTHGQQRHCAHQPELRFKQSLALPVRSCACGRAPRMRGRSGGCCRRASMGSVSCRCWRSRAR